MYDFFILQEYKLFFFYDVLVGLDKMVVFRVFRLDKVVFVVQDFIVDNLGQFYIEFLIFDFLGLFVDFNCCVLFIFVLLFGVDFMVVLLKFGED